MNLTECFAGLEDARHPREKVYKFVSLMFVALCGLMAGEDSFVGIAEYGETVGLKNLQKQFSNIWKAKTLVEKSKKIILLLMAKQFVTMGTLEEQIDLMIESKKELSASILNDDASWLKDLDASTFMDLIKLRKEAFSNGET